MGITTFSGPIKAGTIKSTTGTTLGTDVKNTGQVVMAQTAHLPQTRQMSLSLPTPRSSIVLLTARPPWLEPQRF